MIRAEIKNVVIDEKALHALLSSPSGPVAKELGRIGARIEGRAKELLGGELVHVDTGRLRSSTTWKLFTRGNQIGVAIGSGVHYAIPIHEGGVMQVKAHTRKNPVPRKKGRGRKKATKSGLLARGGGSHTVRAHTRTVYARPYLKIAAAQVLGRPVR